MNKITAVGRLVEDPKEFVSKDKDGVVVGFRFAIPGNFNKEQTSFVNVALFGKTAEIAIKYLHKGDLISLSGELKITSYTTKKGETRLDVSISADCIEMLAAPRARGNSKSEQLADAETFPF